VDVIMIKKVLILCLFIGLTACSGVMPEDSAPTLDATALNQTAVSKATFDAETMASPAPTQTLAFTPTATIIPTIDRTRPPVNTPTPEVPCDKAAAGHPIDVTVPDGTIMNPGESFSKTWRLENVGSCIWTRLYAVTFFSGNSLDAYQTNTLAEPVSPGQQVDVTVDMEAPEEPGVYQSNWMLTNQDGALFGIGPNGDAPFWVKIEVVPAVTETPQPTPTITPTPVVYLSGEAELSDGEQLDLDTGTLNPADPTTADFVYQIGEDPAYILLTMNGTEWMLYGEEEPGFGGCAAEELSGAALSFNDLPEGNYVCYRTSQELPGWFRIVGVDEDEAMFIGFLTWSVAED
jgi:hypothetical protein